MRSSGGLSPERTFMNKLIPLPEACELLGGISKRHLYTLIDDRGEVEAVKLGRRRMVVARSLDDYIERLRAETASV